MTHRGPDDGGEDRLRDLGAAAAVLAQVEAHWEALRGDRLLPLRADVDPRALGAAVGGLFVVQRMAPAPARIRMAGGYADDLMGMEVRGMPLTALFAVADRPRLGALVDAVFTGPEIVRLSLRAPAESGRPPLRAAMILLPLLSDLGDATRALGCLAGEPTGRGAPRRFEIAGAARRDLAAEGRTDERPPSIAPPRPRAPGRRPAAPPPIRPVRPALLARGFAEDGPPPLRPKGPPRLRIVRDEGEGDGGSGGDGGSEGGGGEA